ncbi:MAG: peptidoglycan/LPS O-acetylase OafA/YrhL [Oleiphilaceae bacterium]|jgi:peptidoglycan/LPS O-acetylase OafA/YrhL
MKKHFEVLDGWRGYSILMVLAGHLFPLGFSGWEMNFTVAATGMAVFFVLSGFLITTILLNHQSPGRFLIRRLARVLPIAWLVLLIVFVFFDTTSYQKISTLFFFANWPPFGLFTGVTHFWSLCVEVQFYLLVALSVWIIKDKTFNLLIYLCIAITLNRYFNGVEIAINTYYRLDEILAGCLLAMVYRKGETRLSSLIAKANPLIMVPLLIASCHPELSQLNYFRPYIAAITIGYTLYVTKDHWVYPLLTDRKIVYIASISYAVYVFHGVLVHTWLGEGETLVKYLKRPLLLAVTIGLAHLSTRYFEQYWIAKARKF